MSSFAKTLALFASACAYSPTSLFKDWDEDTRVRFNAPLGETKAFYEQSDKLILHLVGSHHPDHGPEDQQRMAFFDLLVQQAL